MKHANHKTNIKDRCEYILFKIRIDATCTHFKTSDRCIKCIYKRKSITKKIKQSLDANYKDIFHEAASSIYP